MFTLLTDDGKTILENLAGNKIKFVKYAVGKYFGNLPDLRNVEVQTEQIFPVSNLPLFNSYYVGNNVGIRYEFMDDENTVLKCFVPPQFAYFKFNMHVLYVEFSGVEYPFLISYALEENPKFSTTMNRYGTRYFMMFQLKLSNRQTRFDFSNLLTESPEFLYYEHNYLVPNANKIQHDQIIIEKHVNTPENYPVMVIESEQQHYGILSQPWSLEDNYQAITLDDNNIEIDGQILYQPVNSHNSQVILNNQEMDFVFVDGDYQIVVLDDYHIVMYNDLYVVHDPNATNDFLLTIEDNSNDYLLNVTLDDDEDYLLNIDYGYNNNG